jgi:ubiquinone/menaquinone biosynthesis C-methylase UbiE
MGKLNYLLDKLIGKTTVGSANFSTREKWLEKSLASLPPGQRILDAGAGEQPFKKYCSHLKYVSQDFGKYKPEELDAGLQMERWDYGALNIISDIANIPEPDSSFDAIMCTEVFEHIINPREAIGEFARLIKTGGTLIITAPFCSMTHFAPYHFYTGFNRFFYETELAQHGFEIIEITENGNYFEYLAQEAIHLEYFARKYANDAPGRVEKIAIRIFLKMMERFSKKNSQSQELLCFGLHVIAKKR